MATPLNDELMFHHVAQLDNYHTGSVTALGFSKDTALLSICGRDGCVSVYRVQLGGVSPLAVIRLNHGAIGLAVEWIDGEDAFYLGMSDGRVLGLLGRVCLRDWLPVVFEASVWYLSHWTGSAPFLSICFGGASELWERKPDSGWNMVPETHESDVLSTWVVGQHVMIIAFLKKGLFVVDYAKRAPRKYIRPHEACEIQYAAIFCSGSSTMAVEISLPIINVYHIMLHPTIMMIKQQSLEHPLVSTAVPKSLAVVTLWRSTLWLVFASGDALTISHLTDGSQASFEIKDLSSNGELDTLVCSCKGAFHVVVVQTGQSTRINIWSSKQFHAFSQLTATKSTSGCPLLKMEDLWEDALHYRPPGTKATRGEVNWIWCSVVIATLLVLVTTVILWAARQISDVIRIVHP
ncbi:hypothetical protein AURDEDRAFT_172109 [Auricularia subglabra TFB-10046 SS5]|nr:hypothetical protein AURDEDRAFT_172109 [Auricularia subglabra TFB-10046 SS5]